MLLVDAPYDHERNSNGLQQLVFLRQPRQPHQASQTQEVHGAVDNRRLLKDEAEQEFQIEGQSGADKATCLEGHEVLHDTAAGQRHPNDDLCGEETRDGALQVEPELLLGVGLLGPGPRDERLKKHLADRGNDHDVATPPQYATQGRTVGVMDKGLQPSPREFLRRRARVDLEALRAGTGHRGFHTYLGGRPQLRWIGKAQPEGGTLRRPQC
mmetsp:Transcript_91919/g.274267  ORF Transcript_91919/g.274267 Transcript_91919/m.274267 type:complete len:212 (+) Transcript_91919:109-744(+)